MNHSVQMPTDADGGFEKYIPSTDLSWQNEFEIQSVVSCEAQDYFSPLHIPIQETSTTVKTHKPIVSRTPVPAQVKMDSPSQAQPKRAKNERRKAQNRASQRAYRERKESQIKELSKTLEACQSSIETTQKENRQLEAALAKAKQRLHSLKNENQCLKGKGKPSSGSYTTSALDLVARRLIVESRNSDEPLTSDDSVAEYSRRGSESTLCSPVSEEGHLGRAPTDWATCEDAFLRFQESDLGTGTETWGEGELVLMTN